MFERVKSGRHVQMKTRWRWPALLPLGACVAIIPYNSYSISAAQANRANGLNKVHFRVKNRWYVLQQCSAVVMRLGILSRLDNYFPPLLTRTLWCQFNFLRRLFRRSLRILEGKPFRRLCAIVCTWLPELWKSLMLFLKHFHFYFFYFDFFIRSASSDRNWFGWMFLITTIWACVGFRTSRCIFRLELTNSQTTKGVLFWICLFEMRLKDFLN